MIRKTSRFAMIAGLADSHMAGLERNVAEIIEFPRILVDSLPFVPPPRWAAEVPSRLDQTFPRIERRRRILYLKALIHPSYSTDTAAGGTMTSLSPIGRAVLTSGLLNAVSQLSSSGSSSQAKGMVNGLSSQEALSAVLKSHWRLEDMILTDAVVRGIRDARTVKGLLTLVQHNQSASLPMSYHQQCVEAMVGAVYQDCGLVEAHKFILQHVLPPALEYMSLG